MENICFICISRAYIMVCGKAEKEQGIKVDIFTLYKIENKEEFRNGTDFKNCNFGIWVIDGMLAKDMCEAGISRG